MKTCYNVGIIGFGFIGKVHAYAYQNMPFFYDPVPCHTRITHVCTGHDNTAEAARAMLNADVATTDYREITENPDIDIVNICTPNDQHLEQLRSAMAQQKHIYCDKPLVTSLDEAQEIQSVRADYRGTAQLTLQNRFFPPVLRARQLIDEGFVGDVLEFRADYLHSGSSNPEAPMKWKLSGAHGGGVIADLGSHIIDLMDYLVGDFSELMASTHIAYPERPLAGDPSQRVTVDAEDNVQLLLRRGNGAVGMISASKIATGTEDEVRFTIHGSRGAVQYNSMDPHHLQIWDNQQSDQPIGGQRGWTHVACGQRYPKPAAVFPSPKNALGWVRGHTACLHNFLLDVAAGRPGSPGLGQGIYLEQLIHAMRQSATTRQWVSIEEHPEK